MELVRTKRLSRERSYESSFGDEGAAKTLLDIKSLTTLKSPTMGRIASPIKAKVPNARIDDDPRAIHEFARTLALIQKGCLYALDQS